MELLINKVENYSIKFDFSILIVKWHQFEHALKYILLSGVNND